MDTTPPDPAPDPSGGDAAVEAKGGDPIQRRVHTLEARLQDFEARTQVELTVLQEICLYQRKLLVGLLVSLLFLLLGVCLFFGKQMRMVRSQLVEQRPVILNNLAMFHERMEPEIGRFASQLQAFAVSHPDFQPVLERYRGVLSGYFSPLPSTVPMGVEAPEKPAP